ncbi:MAG: hypothetical protein WD187_02410 [Candidatus Woykebacteria bacterium]
MTTSRSGTLLERTVEQILRLVGLNPLLNQIREGYEIDVTFEYSGKKVAMECKQYERSTLAVRNLIHQWDSKNRELNFDKIVLVLIGSEISDKDYQLAKKYDISIWDESKLTSLLNEAIEGKTKVKDKVLEQIGLEVEKGEEKQKPSQREFAETPQIKFIKEKLDELVGSGKRGAFGAFVSFYPKGMDHFVQFALDENSLIMDVPFLFENVDPAEKMEKMKQIRDLLESYNISPIINDSAVQAECGFDSNLIAGITDRIFKQVFQTQDNYEIEVNLELEG